MARFRLKHKTHRRDQLEPTYEEVVIAKRGIVECELESTKKILEQRGYELIEEIKPETKIEEVKPKKETKKKVEKKRKGS